MKKIQYYNVACFLYVFQNASGSINKQTAHLHPAGEDFVGESGGPAEGVQQKAVVHVSDAILQHL